MARWTGPEEAGEVAMTPAEAGRKRAEQAPPITDEQADAAARILASVVLERMQQEPTKAAA